MITYGDGFQFLHPSDPNNRAKIICMVGVGKDMLLVGYDDSSLVLYELPSLNVLDSLKNDWIKKEDQHKDHHHHKHHHHHHKHHHHHHHHLHHHDGHEKEHSRHHSHELIALFSDDERHNNTYVYAGTRHAGIFVLDLSNKLIKLSTFALHREEDLGLTSDMEMTGLQACPTVRRKICLHIYVDIHIYV